MIDHVSDLQLVSICDDFVVWAGVLFCVIQVCRVGVVYDSILASAHMLFKVRKSCLLNILRSDLVQFFIAWYAEISTGGYVSSEVDGVSVQFRV